MKLLIINGPNLNMLGIREPEIYGRRTYAELEDYIRSCCAEVGVECELFQSNYEGAIVERIQAAYGNTDGIVINAAAYTHTSVAIPDAIRAVGIPAVEVHLSEPLEREEFRHISYVGTACEKRCAGKGFESYKEAVTHFSSGRSGELES